MEHLVRWIILEFHSKFLELFPRFTNANKVDIAFSKSTMILHLSTLFLSFIHRICTDFIVNQQPLNHLLCYFHSLLLKYIKITDLRRKSFFYLLMLLTLSFLYFYIFITLNKRNFEKKNRKIKETEIRILNWKLGNINFRSIIYRYQ